MIKGIAVSSGIALAKAFVIKEAKIDVNQEKIQDIQIEIEKLENAVKTTAEQISTIKEKAKKNLSKEELALFDAHMMILQDPEFTDGIKEKIKSDSINGGFAIKTTVDTFAAMFEAMDNEYFRERAADIKDVGYRLMCNFMQVKLNDLSLIDEETIIVAHDLTPSETALIDKKFVRGFVTDIGGKTSHTAIIARTLEIAGIVGSKSASKEIKDQDFLIVDAIEGKVFVNPSQEEINDYKKKAEKFAKYKEELKELKEKPAETLDNVRVELAGNIGSPKDLPGVLENAAEAIGLYRSEFLYMSREDFPSEEEQFKAYKEVIEGMDKKAVIVRTLDIGGDKNLSYFNLPTEMNPFLGFRALRICLEEKEMFKTQLRAILRASAFGKARIMYPMVSSIEQVQKANEILKEVMKELKDANIAFDEEIEVGIMVEIPSVAVMADAFAEYVDFFSIGTNDLCQYTLAVDRMNEKISNLYNPLHPAILRLVKTVIEASHAKNKFTGMCGEMASDPASALLLLGMGLDEFSMNAPSIPAIKKLIRSVKFEDAKNIANNALKLHRAEDVEKYVQEEMKKLNIEVF